MSDAWRRTDLVLDTLLLIVLACEIYTLRLNLKWWSRSRPSPRSTAKIK